MTVPERKALIRAHKDRPCADCGVRYPFYVMHFDHRPGVPKLFELSTLGSGHSLEALQAEMDKCDVVCANCHAERTYGAGGRLSIRAAQAARGAFGGGGRRFGRNPDMTVREAEAAEVRSWARQLLAGIELPFIVADLRARGVPTVKGGAWSTNTVSDILRSPQVAGLAMYRREIVGAASWPAIIEPTVWRQLAAKLASPAPTGNAPRHLGSLIYRCGPCAEAGVEQTVKVNGPLADRLSYMCRAGGPGHIRRAAKHVDACVEFAILGRLEQSEAAGLLEPPGSSVAERWASLPLGNKRAILRVLADVTLLKGKPGRKANGSYFDPDGVVITFKR